MTFPYSVPPALPQEKLHWDGFLTLTQTAHYSPGPTDALDFIDLRPECSCCRCSGDAPGIHLGNRRESCKPSRPWLTLIRVQCLRKSPVYLLFWWQPSVQKGTERALSFFFYGLIKTLFCIHHNNQTPSESRLFLVGEVFCCATKAVAEPSFTAFTITRNEF